MIPSALNPADKVVVGNEAGWLLSFRDANDEVLREIGRDDYYADITASLPSGLEAGEYRFEIEGLTDKHYAEIARTGASPERAAFVDLYLFWRDTAATVTGYLKNLAGLTDLLGGLKSEELGDFLVTRLAVVSVTRKAGARRYLTTVTARERAFHLASRNLVCGEIDAAQPLEVARTIAERAGIDIETYAVEGAGPGDAAQICAPERGRGTRDTLDYLGGRIEQASGKYGRGMLLNRDGVLHIGPRPIPLGADPLALHAGVGLIETEALAPVQTDPTYDPCDHGGAPAPTRKQFKLTLKGRADIKPGHVVEFMPPEEDMSATGGSWTGALGGMAMAAVGGGLLPSLGLGELGPGKVTLYVHSVAHRQGRSSSFVTTVTGVALESLDAAWDTRNRRNQNGCEADAPEPASPAARAARAQRELIQRTLTSRTFAQVGEVRAVNVSGADEPPAQTVTLWRGLAPGDGGVNQSRRLPIQRPSDSVAEAAPYASPFAWGKCGLVLPRYPGTRVVVAHRNADRGEPIDIGALWESGQAPESHPGDWWLILPTEVPADQRRSLADDAAPQAPTGKATNDLIDADGNRVMEVGSFTLRFVTDKLAKAGTRPSAAEPDAVTLEHAEGKSRIVMKKDGSIEIKGEKITLDAGGGDIVLKGAAVKVE